ncbi:MAG: hypothetical protein ACT4OE_09455, partial [Sphingosinicella sp.]
GRAGGGGAARRGGGSVPPPASAFPGARARGAAGRPIGAFTPAVSDPRLAAALARRGSRPNLDFRFTPATPDRVNVAVRAGSGNATPGGRGTAAAAGAPVTAITPSSYNLGVSLGWRRFVVSGDVAESTGGILPGRREQAQVGFGYRANRQITGRVAVAAERNLGSQRLVADDEAYSLDVGGALRIARNVDVTAGARYRIARDRLESLAGEQRHDSQTVYVGTAFRF